MNDKAKMIKDFEKLWAIRGHAEVIVSAIQLDGCSTSHLEIVKMTIERQLELINECIEIGKLNDLGQSTKANPRHS